MYYIQATTLQNNTYIHHNTHSQHK